MITEVETMNNRNLDEYIRTMQELKNEKDFAQTQSSLQTRHLDEHLNHQTKQLEELRRIKAV